MKYAQQIDSAERLIASKGSTAVLTRVDEATFDPVTQTASSTTTTHTFLAVAIPPGRAAEKRIGSLVNRNVLEFYLAQKNQTVEPRPGDKIAWKDRTMTVIWSQTYDPAADGAIMTIAYAE